MKTIVYRLSVNFALIVLGTCSSAGAVADPATSLPPFVYTGRITDYTGAGLDGVTAGAEIRARKNGKLIARAAIRSPGDGTANNYTLVIPMASVDSSSMAVKGDELTFEIDDNTGTDSGIFLATNTFVRIGSPGRMARVDIRAAICTNPHGVADQYLKDIEPFMEEWEIAGPYDPNADWDGDGVSNYDEYLAGTDPFNPDDAGLRILSWKTVEGNPDIMEATFLPGRNRAYSAERRAPDRDSEFEQRPHQQIPAVNAAKKTYLLIGNEDPAVRSIYLFKEGAASLYRLRLE